MENLLNKQAVLYGDNILCVHSGMMGLYQMTNYTIYIPALREWVSNLINTNKLGHCEDFFFFSFRCW